MTYEIFQAKAVQAVFEQFGPAAVDAAIHTNVESRFYKSSRTTWRIIVCHDWFEDGAFAASGSVPEEALNDLRVGCGLAMAGGVR